MGCGRGKDCIKQNKERLKGLVGFEPYPGTVDVMIDNRTIKKIKKHSTKKLSRILLSGDEKVEAWLAPVKVGGVEEKCWVLVAENPPKKNVVELIAPSRIREKSGRK